MSASVSTLRTATGPRAAADADLRLQILGPLRIWRNGVELDAGPPQQAYLLALLLSRDGRPISTNDLIDLIWDDKAPASALNVIHKYVGLLRRLLEPALPAREMGSYLVRQGNGYLFTARPGTLDLTSFRRLTKAAKDEHAAGRPDDALDRYVDALRLWSGSTADALARESAATGLHTALDGEFHEACCAAADLAVALNQSSRVLPSLRLAARMAPLHEHVQAGLARALAADGQQAEALAVFRATRERLAEELGIDPGPALQEAQRKVLSQTGASAPDHEPLDTPVPGPDAQPAQLPPALPTFVGRGRELTFLADLLSEVRTSPLIVAMDGMGGVGKSALATRFAHQVADRFTDGQLYLDLRGDCADEDDLSAGDALRSLLSSLDVPEGNIPATLDARTGAYRSLTARKRILVVLDNARDVAQVRPLLPNSTGCLVLVTSRTPLVGLAVHDGAHLLHVDLPDLPSARSLLRRRLERSRHLSAAELAAQATTLDEIIARCGRLPLALASVAGWLSSRPRRSLATVANELRDGYERPTSFSGGSPLSDLLSAFEWSYRRLSPEAARLLRLFPLTLSAGATAGACASLCGTTPAAVRASLRELTLATLLEEDDRGVYSAHVLVRAYGHEVSLATDSTPDRAAAVTRLSQYYARGDSHTAGLLEAPPVRSELPPPLAG
ncbi:AfsR/SARP family transcriptional regulator [Cryptosporangium arvum]|uniref:AfsR/SARP family transcriptional regulator n=1 Tax=Cryptosporangium arvum TaxID=80871 RepID=UPI001470538D|nr:BTAD domain-containing putative transcriptional regulator [Cryptosporangium arvum]